MSLPQSSAEATVVITGASSGIGTELSEGLARRGYPLLLVARRRERLDALAEQLRGKHNTAVEVMPLDLNEAAARAELTERIAGDPGDRITGDALGQFCACRGLVQVERHHLDGGVMFSAQLLGEGIEAFTPSRDEQQRIPTTGQAFGQFGADTGGGPSDDDGGLGAGLRKAHSGSPVNSARGPNERLAPFVELRFVAFFASLCSIRVLE